ncbi:SLAC1 anion channel family protein [Campylobacter iguaniorum]|uniref:SLAC1 anion channel family protein n=1 Tax=Campylobacter iguaniorum TaxID=1244531 RepID=UPI00210F337C|nr:SLAC1 anion channel family protein [Campylobacter iguaniorum]
MFFAVIMGLGGFGLAYKKIAEIFQIPTYSFEILRLFITLLFFIILGIYIIKSFTNFQNVKEEFAHQIKINFFATIPISLMLLSALWSGNFIADLFFYPGIVLQTYLTFYVIAFWINNNLEIKHSNPAWFIPIVGNLVVIVGVEQPAIWLWYYFSLGIFFWIILFSIIFYRILFHDQLASKFMPTLFIMIAPPAIAFLDYIKLTENFDIFAIILYNISIFFTFLVIFMYKNFIKLKFFLSWWAFTFPTAAMSLACFKVYDITKNDLFLWFSGVIFVLLAIMILFVGYHTIKNIISENICVAE